MPEPRQKPVVDDSVEERRDTGMSIILIGWLCWGFAFLVMFFNPSAIRLGKLSMVEIAIFLAISGFALNIIGLRIRGKKR